jgi:hypothetical protein
MGSENSSSNFPPAGRHGHDTKAIDKAPEDPDSEKDKCRIIPFRRNR